GHGAPGSRRLTGRPAAPTPATAEELEVTANARQVPAIGFAEPVEEVRLLGPHGDEVDGGQRNGGERADPGVVEQQPEAELRERQRDVDRVPAEPVGALDDERRCREPRPRVLAGGAEEPERGRQESERGHDEESAGG